MTGSDPGDAVGPTAFQPAPLPPHLGIAVEGGDLPDDPDDAVHPTSWLAVWPDHATARLRGATGVHVIGGRRAVVHVPADIAATGDSGWIAQGWAVALAMLQRGHLVVHAAAVRVRSGAVCIAGRSGAGKSTTALGMHARGHRLLVDDVSTVVWSVDVPHVLPYRRGVHLAPHAAMALGLDAGGHPPLSADRGKVTIDAGDPGSQPIPITAIITLEPAPLGSALDLAPVTGSDRLRCLLPHLDREGAAPAVRGRQAWFQDCARLAASVPVFRLRRPPGSWSLPAVLDLIDATIIR